MNLQRLARRTPLFCGLFHTSTNRAMLMSFTVINPATGREGNRYEATSEAEITAAIEKADAPPATGDAEISRSARGW
jgi:acyl-CoA reductase-like NAD-dependent aldehyde dehydrogenase